MIPGTLLSIVSTLQGIFQGILFFCPFRSSSVSPLTLLSVLPSDVTQSIIQNIIFMHKHNSVKQLLINGIFFRCISFPDVCFRPENFFNDIFNAGKEHVRKPFPAESVPERDI